MAHVQCSIELNESNFPLFPQRKEKLQKNWWIYDEFRNIVPDELHLFEQLRQRIKDFGRIQHKPKLADVNNISFIKYKCNGK